ncbi:MAG: hypothetical protein HSCHL_0702 [Hydrogenibacillus schlegelii]|uniref:CobQ/CobB/MinD/ParA nucleotide binding domain-containing protein n=1 Tax=Hydrogenibacillus schlegelii TaxID=1484 RepID=A0A2T5G7R9_HYDSH|nr:AAA family ATPase [Hydrogenibacillus schlegelii]PTQ52231.1 MAG: hypothetical protein HSCHL_0702 [Hydrogenibacillus schlegelii]
MKLIIAGEDRFLEEMERLPVEILFIARQPADLHRALFHGGYDEVFIGFPPDVSLQVLRNIRGAKNVAVVFESVGDLQRFGREVFQLGGVPVLLEDVRRRFEKKAARPAPSVPARIVEEELRRREERSPAPRASDPKVFAVYAPKGGVGKTTFSAYFAAHLSVLGKKTVGVDVDNVKVGADLGRRFGFFVRREGTNYRNILDFTSFPAEQYHRWELVRDYVVPVRDFPNLSLVLNPPRPVDLGYGYDLVEKTVAVLRYHFDLVVMDLSPLPSQLNFDVFGRLADRVYFVVTPDPAVVDGARTFIEAATNAGADLSKFHLIINMHDARRDPKPNQIARHVGLPIRGPESILPYDPTFREKRVQMAILTAARLRASAFGKGVERFVRTHLAPEEKKTERKKAGFFILPFFGRKREAGP